MAASFELGAELSTREVLRRAFTAGTGRVVWDGISRSLTFFLTILLARSMGAGGYGAFAVAWYAAWMLSQATDLGLHLVTLRSLSREFRDRLLSTAVAAKAALTLVIVASAVVLHWAQPAYSRSARLLIFLLGAQLIGSWVELCGVVVRSRGQIAREGILLAILRVGWLAAGLWTLSRHALAFPSTSDQGLETLGAALFLASLPALAIALVLASRAARFGLGLRLRLRFPSRSEATALARQALPLAATSAITLLYLRADLLIVAALRSSTDAGLFQSAFRLLEATFVLSGGIAAGTFPFLAARSGREGFDGLTRLVLGLELAVGAPLGSAFVLLSDRIVTLVYGESFRGAAPALSFLGVALVAIFLNAGTTHLLVASGRTGRLVLSMMVRLVVGIAVDFILVPSWGATGAALAVAVAEWSLLAATLLGTADLLSPKAVSPGTAAPEGASS
jgi:O-antigen/teichoic acid export membrane protein